MDIIEKIEAAAITNGLNVSTGLSVNDDGQAEWFCSINNAETGDMLGFGAAKPTQDEAISAAAEAASLDFGE